MKKKVLRIVGSIMLALVMSFSIGLSFYSYNARVINNDALPMPFGLGISVVYSGSMEPTYSPGDLVFVTKADVYVKDDIVVFQRHEKAVMHRLLSINGDTVITKGDANNVADEPISVSDIKGKVVFTIPLIGHVIRFIKSTAGTIIRLAIAFFLFEVTFIREKIEQRKNRELLIKEIEQLKSESNEQ